MASSAVLKRMRLVNTMVNGFQASRSYASAAVGTDLISAAPDVSLQKAHTWDEGVSSKFATTPLKDIFKDKKSCYLWPSWILVGNQDMYVFVEGWLYFPFLLYFYILSCGLGLSLVPYGSLAQEIVCLKKVRSGVSLFGCCSATVDLCALLVSV